LSCGLSGKLSGFLGANFIIRGFDRFKAHRLKHQLLSCSTTRTRMKAAYWLFKRGDRYYTEDARTGKQTSLGTTNQGEAERLLAAKNEAANQNSLSFAVGQIYLNATDPALMTRTWADVMKIMVQRGGKTTQDRTRRAFESRPFDIIRRRVIHETHSADFLNVLNHLGWTE